MEKCKYESECKAYRHIINNNLTELIKNCKNGKRYILKDDKYVEDFTLKKKPSDDCEDCALLEYCCDLDTLFEYAEDYGLDICVGCNITNTDK